MGKIVKLKNANDVYTYPVTKTEAVYLEDNKTTLKDYLDAMAITKTTGPAQVVTFNDGADNVPVKSLILNIEPHQEGAGDPSPENIRSITGYNEVNITRSGKNLLHIVDDSGTNTSNGITYNIDTTTNHIIITGTSSASNADLTRKYIDPITIKEGETITFSLSGTYSSTGNIRLFFFKDTQVVFYLDSSNGIWSYTAPEDVTINKFYIRTPSSGTTVNVDAYMQLERGDAATDYEPYAGQTYQVTIPSSAGTIYSGTLDVGNGELIITSAIKNAPPISSVGQASSGIHYVVIYKSNFPNVKNSQVICNKYKSVTTVPQSGDTGIRMNNNIYIYDDAFAGKTIEEATEMLADLQILYELDTPQTYTLTPGKITTLLGNNVFWTNTEGNLQIIYKADLATYIANAISSSRA